MGISGLLNIAIHWNFSFKKETPSDALHFHLINLLEINLLHHVYLTIITKKNLPFRLANYVKVIVKMSKGPDPHVSKINIRQYHKSINSLQ